MHEENTKPDRFPKELDLSADLFETTITTGLSAIKPVRFYRISMPVIDLNKLNTHRTRTFNLPPSKRLSSPSQAVTFVNKRGFVYFWPNKGIDLPPW